MEDFRLGALLLEGGLVDEAGLERCLSIQALTGSTRPIGQVLVEQGLLDQATLVRLLELQKSRVEARQVDVATAEISGTALLTAAFANGASELVVSEGRSARIRVGTIWRELTQAVLGGPEVWDFVREVMGTEVLEELAERHFVVRPWGIDGVGNGSASAFRQFDGVAARVTFVAEPAASVANVALPASVTDAVLAGKGLVLCVGERGIGRGEVLAALVQLAAKDPGHYTVVVDDDPVELPSSGSLVVRRRYGIEPRARAEVLRSVVREDPDAMVIADVGSPETFELALRAAEGGRLVVAWLDAANVVSALTRITNFYALHDLPRVRSTLAAVLRAVFVRQLLPDADHAGTVAASELLVVDDAAREVIRHGDLLDIAFLLRADNARNNHSLDGCMLDLLLAGKVRVEDVFARAEEKAWLLERTRSHAEAS